MAAASIKRLLKQLEDSQWWSAEQLRDYQFGKLRTVLRHAAEHVPYYCRWFAENSATPDELVNEEAWRRFPTLGRFDLQDAGDELHSPLIPEGHGPVTQKLTSGSTGAAVMTLATEVTSLFWRAMTIREHQWHGRDFAGKLASIRYGSTDVANPPEGARDANWGSATRGYIETGPGVLLSVFSTTSEQSAWLQWEDPHYLMTYPSVLAALAEYCEEHGHTLSNLREVRTFGEVLDPEVREVCWKAWKVPLVDVYSCQETGYLGLQCPEQGHYHVPSEDVIVEVLDVEGRPCQPGDVGRIVITTLHNFAMPLFRYDIGDYAEVGEPCSCGRGLPVLKRILGRSRNMFVLPNGDLIWPSLEISEATELQALPVRQYQVIQRDREHVDAFLVARRELTPDEELLATRSFHNAIRYPFQMTYHYVDEISRSPAGKYEEFRSDVT